MAYIVLKLMLKRFFISKSLINRSHFKSKSTLSKDEDVDTTTPGSGIDDQLKVVHRQRDFSDSVPQSLYSMLRGSDFYQVAFRRRCRELAIHSHLPLLEFARVVGQCRPHVVLQHSQRASSQTYNDWQNAAKNRLFFTSIAGLVQRVFYGGVLLNAEDVDEGPRDHHPVSMRRHLPRCAFVPDLCSVLYIPGGDQDELQGVEDLRHEDHQHQNDLHVRLTCCFVL